MMDAETNSSQVTYLIIGGATRSGTTALFDYLAVHPEICRSTLKETRFFLDRTYPVPRVYGYYEGLEKYSEYFSHCEKSRVRLEGTPDYLFSKGAAMRIRSALSSARLVFVLRDPVDRLVSWYKFARQKRMIGPGVTFEEYVKLQPKTLKGIDDKLPQHLRILQQGNYSLYLKHYLRVFAPEQILVTKTGALRQTPGAVLHEVCEFAGISPQFYQDFQFEIKNRSVAIRFTFLEQQQVRLARFLRMSFHNKTRTRNVFRQLWHAVRPIYRKFNVTSDEDVVITSSLAEFLDAYYAREREFLSGLNGKSTISNCSIQSLEHVMENDSEN